MNILSGKNSQRYKRGYANGHCVDERVHFTNYAPRETRIKASVRHYYLLVCVS